jgi:hypothetical protein
MRGLGRATWLTRRESELTRCSRDKMGGVQRRRGAKLPGGAMRWLKEDFLPWQSRGLVKQDGAMLGP